MTESEKNLMSFIYEKYLKAGHPDTPISELWNLAADEIDNVRRRVAENPLCPQIILRALSSDEHPDVRIAVAEHPDTPKELLAELSKDGSPDVRHALAENPNLPREILILLVDDENPYVAHRAQRTLRQVNPGEVAKLSPRQDIGLANKRNGAAQ